MKSGIELIGEERARQITKEGYGAEHDTRHNDDELAMAAVAYALPDSIDKTDLSSALKYLDVTLQREIFWPWDHSFFKPSPYNDRIRELVKAGALIAAEIDRLQNL